MAPIRHEWRDNELTVFLEGIIDSQTAPLMEAGIFALMKQREPITLNLDCDKLDYISSAGLRMVMRLAKVVRHVRFSEVWPETYTLLETTGFDTMFKVSRAMRAVSVEGCPVVGRGSKGIVYRIGGDTIVKVNRDENALDEIKHEREAARAAFIAGVPTAISYDVVRVGDGYGSVFEMLDAVSLGDLLAAGKMSVEEAADESVELLRQIHATKADLDLMPDIRMMALDWLHDAQHIITGDQYGKLNDMINSVPRSHGMVHGDFHVNNIMVQGGECLLIDMATLSHGDEVFELASTYNTYVGRGLIDPTVVERFMGIPYDVAKRLWELTLHGCLDTTDADEIARAQDRISLLAAVRMIGHPRRRGYTDTDKAYQIVKVYGDIIDELLPKVDSLSLG